MNITGVAFLLGVSRATVYRRIERGTFSLVGVKVMLTTRGALYDMEDVFKRVFPSADDNTIAGLMYEFMRTNRGLVR